MICNAYLCEARPRRSVFCAISLDSPICRRSVNNIIKKSVVRVKSNRPREMEISGHSLSVGAAQDLLI